MEDSNSPPIPRDWHYSSTCACHSCVMPKNNNPVTRMPSIIWRGVRASSLHTGVVTTLPNHPRAQARTQLGEADQVGGAQGELLRLR